MFLCASSHGLGARCGHFICLCPVLCAIKAPLPRGQAVPQPAEQDEQHLAGRGMFREEQHRTLYSKQKGETIRLQAARRRRTEAEPEESQPVHALSPGWWRFPAAMYNKNSFTLQSPALGCCAGLSVTWLWCCPDRPHICPCLHIVTRKEQLCLISPGLPHSTFKHCRANNQPCRSCRNAAPMAGLAWGGSRSHSGALGPVASPACRCLESSNSLRLGEESDGEAMPGSCILLLSPGEHSQDWTPWQGVLCAALPSNPRVNVSLNPRAVQNGDLWSRFFLFDTELNSDLILCI